MLVCYTREEARAEWGERENNYITKGYQERGSDDREFYNFISGQTSSILGEQVFASPWAFSRTDKQKGRA